MSKKYLIHKKTRIPDEERGSYSGTTWDTANLRHRYKPFYYDKGNAEHIASILTRYNKIGFKVHEIT